MPALEHLSGVRVVATPEALDGAPWGDGTVVLRLAADEAFALGTSDIAIGDDDAIVSAETGFVGAWLTADELVDLVVPHVEWSLPQTRPALAQGLIAGVPAKLWLETDRALLVCPAAYGRELADRLG